MKAVWILMTKILPTLSLISVSLVFFIPQPATAQNWRECAIFYNNSTCLISTSDNGSSQIFRVKDKSGTSFSIKCNKPLSSADRFTSGIFFGQKVTCYYSISTRGHRSILVNDKNANTLVYFEYAHPYGR